MKPIPVNQPRISSTEEKYVLDCLKDAWLSGDGPYVKKFEAAMTKVCNRQHAVAVSNGTVALELGLRALDLKAGDEVILPTFCIISCLAAIHRCGATPVLVDSDPITWNMDATQVKAKINAKTKAIMVVHTYGLPVDMDPILELCKTSKLFLIEDAAEMHGQTYRGKPCGSFGTLSTFSFYANKLVTTGEGGMILCDDPQLADRLRSLRNLCFQPKRRFVHEELGYNARLSNVLAAIGCAQVEALESTVKRKREIGAKYNTLLSGASGISIPLVSTPYADNLYWVYGIVLQDSLPIDADELARRLLTRGVETRPFFWPMHEQPWAQKNGFFKGESYPHAERLARRGLYLPCGVGISDQEIAQVADVVRATVSEIH